MDDLIRRQDAITAYCEHECGIKGMTRENCGATDCGTIFDDIPPADVRENVRGKWQPIEVQPYFKKHFNTSVACSVCHRKGDNRWNFCPNCGARMESES